MSHGERSQKTPPEQRALRFVSALILFSLPAIGLTQAIADGTVSSLAPLCVADEHTLCLNDNRFAVTASFQQTPLGPSVAATAERLTSDTGYFWFFDASNIEVITKVLNGCGLTDSYWVFAAGLTNVGVHLTVMDMQFGGLQSAYDNPIGTPFAPIQDTGAFRTCP